LHKRDMVKSNIYSSSRASLIDFHFKATTLAVS
jgi:hypothetical protein